METSENLFCGICQRIFNDNKRKPLNLPCGDTFCSFCIQLQVQPQAYIKCQECKEIHNDLSVNQLQVNKPLLNIIMQYTNKKVKLLCDCQEALEIKFFCKKEEKMQCQNCRMNCFEHKSQVLQLVDINQELQQMKDIIENLIMHKALQLSTQLRNITEQNEAKTSKGDQIHQLATQLVQFIKEVSEVEPKTQYFQYLRAKSRFEQEEFIRKQKDIEDLEKEYIQMKNTIPSKNNLLQQQLLVFNDKTSHEEQVK